MAINNDPDYMPRLMDGVLKDHMRLFGGVVITGPKWCGKTTTAERVAESGIYLQDRKQYNRYRSMANLDPSLLLRGGTPVLVDEWQKIPEIWDAARYQIDKRKDHGLFILTGSKMINDDEIDHSGAGRISRLKMRTMSLWESGLSTGDVSLSGLFDGADSVSGLPEYGFEGMAEHLVHGGWPDSINLDGRDAYRKLEGYCNAIIDHDYDLDAYDDRDGASTNVKRSSKGSNRVMRSLLRSLSKASASEMSATNILADMNQGGTAISINTLHKHLNALQNICITDNLQAWSPQLRSKTAIRTSETRHLTDPAIAAYFLDAGPDDLISDPNTFGLLFETMVVRDLRVYAQTMDGHVCHYRDKNGLEVDAIVHLPRGRWGAIEVKLNDSWADEAARNLMALKDKVDPEGMRPPSFLAVVTADGAAYTREDGVHVIPLSCLKN